MVLLTKVIASLASPVVLVLLLLCISFFTRRRIPTLSGMALFSGILTLFILSSPKVGNTLLYSLEKQYPAVHVEETAQADAIVLLAGGLDIPIAPRKVSELGSRGDRLLLTFRLYEAGKASKIVISGGNAFASGALKSESEYIAELFGEWGIPQDSIIIEGDSRNTRQSVLAVAELLEDHEIDSLLLVTSAYHMPRSFQLFQHIAPTVIPVTANHLIVDAYRPEILNWVPSSTSLDGSSLALYEYLGLLANYFSPVASQIR